MAPKSQNVPALMERAKKALDTCEPDLARKFLLKALQIAPNNATILEALGIVEMEAAAAVTAEASANSSMGDEEMSGIESKCEQLTLAAEDYFRKAVESDANAVGSAAFMYLGQMAVGPEAIEFYEQGINRFTKELEGLSEDDDEASKAHQKENIISPFLTSYVDTISNSDEPEAESNCESYVYRGLEIDPTNPELHQTLASVRLSQCRPQEAKVAIEQSLSLWSNESPESIQWPAYPQRIACVKILLELGLYENALSVLQTCQQENDQDAEGWYLFAWCYYRMAGGEAGAEDQEIAASMGGVCADSLSLEQKVAHLIDAKECLERLQQLNESPFTDVPEDTMDHAKHIYRNVEAFLGANEELVKKVLEEDDEDFGIKDDDDMEM
ncbi:hypothetical protein HDV05_004823 [Chytridiales sp. JEL 0842]|nr:hypothetical protein HDV05_004823 [Chytridiales sp. JEL 0842]